MAKVKSEEELNILECDIQGLYYIDAIEDTNVISKLDKKKWIPLTDSPSSRMVQHYGFKYNYKTYNIHKKCKDIPRCLSIYKDILTKICLDNKIIEDDYVFNQCIVNNYLPSQGIGRHTDIKSYGDVIGCFTFGSGAIMTFKHGKEQKDIFVKPNSLYIMSGDARYKWTHEMNGRKYDMVDGIKIERDRRISVTFRNVS